jgi:DNA-binding LytR/AlgR family response regulator
LSLSCYIVDNEEFAIDYLAKHIRKTPGLELLGSDTNPLEVLRKFSAGELKADICFLDIEMPQLSGLELASLIQAYTHIIFTTAHEHFALQAFDTDVIDYLLKPIEYPRFLKSIQKVQKMVLADVHGSVPERTFIFVQSAAKGKMIRINFEDIYHIDGASNYVRIIANDTPHLTYLTLTEMEHILPASVFMRVHRSHLININKVKALEGGMIHLSNGESVSLGTTYRKDFLDRIDPHLIRSSRQP